MTKAVLLRAARSFLAAFVAGVSTQLATGVTINSVADLKKLGISLLVAGITGGLMALDKMLRYENA